MTRTYLPIEETGERVFTALAEAEDGLICWELERETGLTRTQWRYGWQWVRHILGPNMAMCLFVKGRGWVYLLTANVRDGLEYQLWLARHARTRTASLLATVDQQGELDLPEGVRSFRHAAERGLVEAHSNYRTLVRALGHLLDYSDAEVESWLVDLPMTRPELNGAV